MIGKLNGVHGGDGGGELGTKKQESQPSVYGLTNKKLKKNRKASNRVKDGKMKRFPRNERGDGSVFHESRRKNQGADVLRGLPFKVLLSPGWREVAYLRNALSSKRNMKGTLPWTQVKPASCH